MSDWVNKLYINRGCCVTYNHKQKKPHTSCSLTFNVTSSSHAFATVDNHRKQIGQMIKESSMDCAGLLTVMRVKRGLGRSGYPYNEEWNQLFVKGRISLVRLKLIAYQWWAKIERALKIDKDHFAMRTNRWIWNDTISNDLWYSTYVTSKEWCLKIFTAHFKGAWKIVSKWESWFSFLWYQTHVFANLSMYSRYKWNTKEVKISETH